MSRNREVELKLEVEQGCSDALLRHPLLRDGPAKEADQVSVYYDTPDGALRGAGYSLRVRQSGGRCVQTVKQAAGVSAGLFDRPEWEWETGGFEPDLDAAAETPLGQMLGRKVRKRLAGFIRVEAHRSTWNIERSGSRIELTLDRGVVTGGGADQPIAELELELKKGEPAELFALARELADAAPLRLGVLTKAERGYRLADGTAGKAVKSEPIALRHDMNVAEGFSAIAFACLRQFRLNEPLVAEQRDSSALHQARVAMRRLRSGFTLFRPAILDEDYEELREEVRWFTNQLGDARNLDVLLKRFSSKPEQTSVGKALNRKLKAERDAAYEQVLTVLRSERLRRLMLDLAAWIETGAWRSRNELVRDALPDFANVQLGNRWKKVRKGGKKLTRINPEARHRLRIEVKKLRYAVEFLASLATEDSAIARQKQFVQALEDMQEKLGELNDLQTARTLLGNMLPEMTDSSELLRYADSRLEAPESERMQLGAAQKAHARLIEVGPFWRWSSEAR